MTKTLGSAALHLYSKIASLLLPIPTDQLPLLVADLEADPFVGHALNTVTCELYHRYGMYLAPVTAVLGTIKHCRAPSQYQQQNGKHIRDGDINGGTGGGGTGGGGTTGDAGTRESN